MQIQINTDSNIDGNEAFATHVRGVVTHALGRLTDHITRVEVHLNDENGAKSGQADKRCMLEARMEGRRPTAVTHHAGSVHEAVDGAAEKLKHVIETTVEKRVDARRQ